jgi:DNA repair exonuclease SbcCD ATPase subunit
MSHQQEPEAVHLSVRNIGGIDAHEATFQPGVTILVGRNATNRTSLLRALSGALGGSAADLKSDADEGEVTLALDGEQYGRQYERHQRTTRISGDQYAEDGDLVDRFASLLASNPVRRAVERGDGDELRDLLMGPVDTERIREQVRDRRRELREVTERLDAIADRREERPALEERRTRLEADLADTVADLESVREAVDAAEADADAAEAAEEVMDDLQAARSDLEEARADLDTQRSAVESLHEERRELSAALDDLDVPEDDLEGLESDIDRLRQRERDIESTVSNLRSIVEFNEGLLDGDGLPGDAGGAESVVSELDPMAESVECWTCGTTVERGDVADRIEELRDVVEEKRARRNEVRERVAEIRDRAETLRERIDERDRLREKLRETDAEIERREERVADLERRVESLVDRVDDLEAAAANTEGLRDSDLLDRYQRLSELEYERGQLEQALADVEDELAEIAALRDEATDLEKRQTDLREEVASLRNSIADRERAAVETFNEEMATVLDLLAYENVERVWIERSGGEETLDGDDSTFELHVVRSTADGAVYEDTVEHLSESEREVIGLVVALAGYLVHDVHESVPVMLLDSLEAIDAERIAALLDYFAEYPPYLVAALLPGDARALDEEYDRLTMDGATA